MKRFPERRIQKKGAYKNMYDFSVGSFEEEESSFEWDEEKNRINQEKHGVSFEEAQFAFADPLRLIVVDVSHSSDREIRLRCIGRIEGGIVTVRYTEREGRIRIFGSGYWRKERKSYEEKTRKVQ
jgi:uncharacterized DUF497 family protein